MSSIFPGQLSPSQSEQVGSPTGNGGQRLQSEPRPAGLIPGHLTSSSQLVEKARHPGQAFCTSPQGHHLGDWGCCVQPSVGTHPLGSLLSVNRRTMIPQWTGRSSQ